MRAPCEKHGEVEYRVDKNGNAWCVECEQEAIEEALTDPEKRQELSHALIDEMRKVPPRSFIGLDGERHFAPIAEFDPSKFVDIPMPKAVTTHKPGTPGYIPPPPRPFGETPGIEPPYATTYRRRVLIKLEDLEEDGE